MVAVGRRAASTWKPVPRVCRGRRPGGGGPGDGPEPPSRRRAEALRSGPGISPVSHPQPRPSGPPPPKLPRTRAQVPSRLHPQARSPAARTSSSSATPRGSPRTGAVTALPRPWLGRLRTCPLGSGSGRGPPQVSWDPCPFGPPGLAETPGPAPATPGRFPVPPRPALKRKRERGWRGLRFSCTRSAEAAVTRNHLEQQGIVWPLGCPAPTTYPPSRGWGREGLGRRRLLCEPPMPSQRGI